MSLGKRSSEAFFCRVIMINFVMPVPVLLNMGACCWASAHCFRHQKMNMKAAEENVNLESFTSSILHGFTGDWINVWKWISCSFTNKWNHIDIFTWIQILFFAQFILTILFFTPQIIGTSLDKEAKLDSYITQQHSLILFHKQYFKTHNFIKRLSTKYKS